MLDVFLELATLFYGGHLAMKDQLTVGHFMGFVLYQMSLGGNLEVGFCWIFKKLALSSLYDYIYTWIDTAWGPDTKAIRLRHIGAWGLPYWGRTPPTAILDLA